RLALDSDRHRLGEARDQARNLARESRDTAHALALTLESHRAQIASLTQALQRMSGQRGQLDLRLDEISGQLTEGDSPVDDLEQQRQLVLEQRVLTGEALSTARSILDGIDQELRRFEQVRQQRDEQALAQREGIGQRRLEQQALVLKAEALVEAVVEAGFVLEDVVNTLTDDMEPTAWERTVQELDGKLR